MSQIQPHFTIYREDFVDEKFPPHGDVKQSLMGQVIVDEAHGPFNRELLEQYEQKAAPLYMQAKAAGKFVTLSLFSGSMMMGQETIAQFVNLAVNYVSHKIAPEAVAFVADDEVDGRDFMFPIIKAKVFDPVGVPIRLFTNRAKAELWLKEKILSG